jgi:hypothetical protein
MMMLTMQRNLKVKSLSRRRVEKAVYQCPYSYCFFLEDSKCVHCYGLGIHMQDLLC